MKFENICLVMTGCISPPAQVVKLCVRDKDYREQQYIQAICFYIENTAIKNIVFCDNSAHPLNEMLCKKAREKRKNFEWLSFQGNTKKTEEFGKGYGEGEILEYAINNSKLINNCKYMAKVTGRLRLLNIDNVLRLLFSSPYHFSSFLDKANHLFVDTRFFVVETDCFRDEFLLAYKNVNDSNGYIYEYAIADIIQKERIKYRSFPLALNIAGDSGSSGYSYQWTQKMLLKKTIPLFIYYFLFRRNYCKKKKKLGEELVWGDYVWHSNFRRLEGKKIIIYGAGRIGKNLYMLCKKHCLIVAWVDGNYEKIRRVERIKIMPPAAMDRLEFDYILIAVKDERMMEQIKDNILKIGISANKIVWGMPILSVE